MPITKLNPVELTGVSAVEELEFLVGLTSIDQVFAYLERYFLSQGWKVLEQLEFNPNLYDRLIEFDNQFRNISLCVGKSYTTVVMIAIKAALEAANYHKEYNILTKKTNNYVHWTDELFRESRGGYFFNFGRAIQTVRDNVQDYPINLTKFNEEFQKLINHENCK